MYIVFIFIFYSIFSIVCYGQQTIIEGNVIDFETSKHLSEVTITIESHDIIIVTDLSGHFSINKNVPVGNLVLKLEKEGYKSKRYPIVVKEGELLVLEDLVMDYDIKNDNQIFAITINEDELSEGDDILSENISGLLQSSKDVFLKAAAYDFSATFFRPRGLGSEYGLVMINGLVMNKPSNGRPLWANWGGLNDAQRNQQFQNGLSPNDYSINGVAGSSNISMRASRYGRGGRINFSSANKSYNNRLMVSYNSGINPSGWSYSILGSYRFAREGYIDGTIYKSHSIFAAIEKQLNASSALNFSIIYSKNKRGRSSPITSEVYNLKKRRYNSNWGYQDGKIRNSKVREINEPILMLNHYWDLSHNMFLNSSVAYQFGSIGNTRIDNGGTRLVNFNNQESYLGGATNPDPSYYQHLPSYFLRQSNDEPTAFDYELAYIAEQEFINNGQLDWNHLYESNITLADQGYPSVYVLQEDRSDTSQLWANSLLNYSPAPNKSYIASINFISSSSNNYALIKDLLGGNEFLDIDFFADEGPNSTSSLGSIAQSDLRNKNRHVKTGDHYKYNYIINFDKLELFLQTKRSFEKLDFHFGTNLSLSSIYRIGNYENGHYPGSRSYGPSEKIRNFNYGLKLGGDYKINAQHIFGLNGALLSKAPSLNNLFNNPRQNNDIISRIKSETISAIELNYFYRSTIIKSRISAYQYNFNGKSNVGYYFTEDIAGLGLTDGNAFVQEISTNIASKNIGLEFGMECQITSTINLKAAAAIGQYTYTNNPNLYLTSNIFNQALTFGDGTSKMKNLHVPSGPEKAIQLGFEYRDPDYWWFGATANYFSDAYINISKLARSSNFNLDFDGQPLNDYDPEIAKQLLEQEKFPSYFLFNLIGGKSWTINGYYLGFFAVINNVFNQSYISGGYEQSRLANYTSLKQDKLINSIPVFGSRYYYGNGTTYFLNMYLRF